MENVTVNDLIALLNKDENRYGGATHKERLLSLTVNGEYLGYLKSAELDGYGDGLVTDVGLYITTDEIDIENPDTIMTEVRTETEALVTATALNDIADFRLSKKVFLKMTLKTFINFFVCHNTLVRLWKPYNGRHKMLLTENGKETCMEWQILNGKCHKKYADCYVIGVTDIVCEKDTEAVNIVIDLEE